MSGKPGSAVALLRTHPIWQDAQESAAKTVAAASKIEATRPGQLFVREGQPAEHVHLLIEGVARAFYVETKSRPQTTVTLLRAPSVIGDLACILRGAYTASVEALLDSTSLVIPAGVYFAALHQSPTSCLRQYFDLAERFGGAVANEKVAYSASLNERVVGVLAAYAREMGEVRPDGIRITASLTQDDLAVQTGASRRTVVRSLAVLYEAGVLRRVGRQYEVTSIEALLAAAKGAPDMAHRTKHKTWIEELRQRS